MENNEEKGIIVKLPVAKAFSTAAGKPGDHIPPGFKRYPTLEIGFMPGLGMLARSFPTQVAFRPDIMSWVRENRGLVEIRGKGGIGTTFTFTFANGRVTYEIEGRANTIDEKIPYLIIAKRTHFKPFDISPSRKGN